MKRLTVAAIVLALAALVSVDFDLTSGWREPEEDPGVADTGADVQAPKLLTTQRTDDPTGATAQAPMPPRMKLLRVSVLDEEGEAVSGMELRLTVSGQVLVQRTGSSGVAEFRVAREGAGLEFGETPQWVHPMQRYVNPDELSLEVRLEHGHVVSGRVLDEDGNAVPGASVHVKEKHAVWLAGSGVYYLESNEDGQFQVRVPRPWKGASVTAWAPKARSRLVTTTHFLPLPPSASTQLVLKTPNSLAGRVYTTGPPPVGSVVFKECDTGTAYPFGGSLAVKAGVFSTDGVPRGRYRALFLSASPSSGDSESVTISVPGPDVILESPATKSFRFESTTPVGPQQSVRWIRHTGWGEPTGGHRARQDLWLSRCSLPYVRVIDAVLTGSHTWSIHGVVPGEGFFYFADATRGRCATASATEPGASTLLDKAQPGVVRSGKVTAWWWWDEGMTVQASGRRCYVSCAVDDNGEFTLPPLPRGATALLGWRRRADGDKWVESGDFDGQVGPGKPPAGRVEFTRSAIMLD